jgi:hypothetical protein
MTISILVSVIALSLLAQADVLFTSPLPGQSLVFSKPLTVSWEESGFSPNISQLSMYQLILCTGGFETSNITPLLTLVRNGDFSGSSYLNVTLDQDMPTGHGIL